jgi:hypothetical protein
MGSGSGVLAHGSVAPRSTKSNGGVGQTLADPETTATKEMRCTDLRDGWQWRWRWRWRTRSKAAAVVELGGGGGGAPESDPASTSHARERPNDSEVEGCHGGGKMPGRERQRMDAGRGRPDAVVAVASRLGGAVSGRRKLASRTGKPSWPNESWISSARKTLGSGCDPRLGGLPKGTQIWPGGGWHGAD